MSRNGGAALSGLIFLFSLVSLPANACAVGFKPDTSGFPLNPKLDRLTVTSAKPTKPNDVCLLHVDDQIVQVNEHPVPGARALALMAYWKSLGADTPIKFRIKRGDTIITVVTK
jgi:hypothetical protein